MPVVEDVVDEASVLHGDLFDYTCESDVVSLCLRGCGFASRLGRVRCKAPLHISLGLIWQDLGVLHLGPVDLCPDRIESIPCLVLKSLQLLLR